MALVPLAPAASHAQQMGNRPPPAVVVETARLEDLSSEHSFTGRIEAIDKVGITARIQGYIKKRDFEEGREVEKGQLLFEIEPDTYEVVVSQAEANLASANAALTLAQKTFERTRDLARRNTASVASLDDARSQLLQAQANVQAREADLQTARLNLGFTNIKAPFAGLAGRAAYSVGALVGPTSNPLVTLVAQDPMYVTFPVPQKRLLEVRKQGLRNNSVFVRLTLADGSTYDQNGKILFSDVQATSGTDSVIVRASIANPKRLLVDQQLVQVTVVRKKPEKRLVVSQSALLLDQQGAYVFVVGKDDKVAIRRIKTGRQSGPLVVVDSGLQAGERVIVAGHQKVQPGIKVTPSQAQAGPDAGMGGMGGVVGMGGMSGQSSSGGNKAGGGK